MTKTEKEKPAKNEKAFGVSMAMQGIFVLFTTLTALGCIPFTYYGYVYMTEIRKDAPKDKKFPALSDYSLTAMWSVIFAILEITLHRLFQIPAAYLCKTQEKGKEKEKAKRVQKMAYSFYRGCYFLVATSWGYIVFKDEPWMPWQLGGKGYYIDAFVNVPYGSHPKGLDDYILVTMGFHVGGLVTHFCGERRNDFMEMCLHHLVALFLFGGCYSCNMWEVGGIIAFLHDIADITTNFVKFLADTPYSNLTAVWFVIHMIIWGWTRNLVLPYMIYTVFTQDMPVIYNTSGFIIPFFCYLLSCMCMLHYYWFSLFVLMLSRFMGTGATEDE